MLFIKTKRILKSGFLTFWRNGWVSLAAILIMVITLFSIGAIIFSRVVLSNVLDQIQDRVDVSVYFKTKTVETDIMSLKKTLEDLPEVKEVTYVPAEKALTDFKERHKDNALLLQALDQLDENPLGAILNVKAKEVSQYETVSKFLEGETEVVKGQDTIIDKVNYFQNKKIIDTLSRIIDSTRRLGVSISLFFIIISILVTFNTIGLVIYTSKEEIEVMRLVGASNRFVSGPFVVEGVMYGVVSAIITMVVYYPVTLWLGPATKDFFSGIDISRYYLANFGQIFLVLLGMGVFLGVVSSFIATRRYLRI